MSKSISVSTRILCLFLSAAFLSPLLFAQTAPTLGTVATYGAFTSTGSINNTGLTQIVGDIGTNAGNFVGFPPGVYTGAKHVADPESLVAKGDLTTAWNQLGTLPCDAALAITIGNGQVLTSQTYCAGAASTLTGTLTLDAQGDPNAIFVIKIDGALNAAATSRIVLANLAQASNVYWRINGAVSVLDNSVFKGTIIANGAIHLYGGTTLEGRALSIVGAITMASNMMTVPVSAPSSITVVRPSAGETIAGGTKNYRIEYVGVNATLQKTFEYSLDGGTTWILIGSVRNDSSSYGWDVPNIASTQAVVRITDSNGVTGRSNMFTITSDQASSIVVTRPASGEALVGGTQGYRIEFRGVNVTQQKKLEYSPDSGATWTLIALVSNNDSSYSWNVPQTPTTKGLVRITDSNGVAGTSGMFTIEPATASSLIVVRPAAGEVIVGGTQGYQIQFAGVNLAQKKTFEYSLDGGATWILIGVDESGASSYSWNVPAIASTQALVRITDADGVTGTSGMFTIRIGSTGDGSIDALTLGGVAGNKIGNGMPIDISWTFTPEIGPSVTVEYSLDGGYSWNLIGVVPTSGAQSIRWTTPATGYYQMALVRVTSTMGMQRTSDAFTIGSPIAAVRNAGASSGFSITSFPNPASGATTIRFMLPTRGTARISVVDIVGREVGAVAEQQFEAGIQEISFDASALPAGIYTYTLQSGTTRVSGRMTIVR
jgi:hypothetical protein